MILGRVWAIESTPENLGKIQRRSSRRTRIGSACRIDARVQKKGAGGLSAARTARRCAGIALSTLSDFTRNQSDLPIQIQGDLGRSIAHVENIIGVDDGRVL
jgi:hypothetical protein